jgi:dolichol-phosphate mannosyltransferase
MTPGDGREPQPAAPSRPAAPPTVSVVVPVYRGAAFLPELYRRVKASASECFAAVEIIFVNDACPQDSWPIIRRLCEADPCVKGINLARNFGQHYAITAGLTYARNEWVVVMDCDLQDLPEEIPRLYQRAAEGFDSVFAQRLVRQDSWLKRQRSRMFYALFGYLTDTRMDASVANFGIYHRRVIEAILSMGDKIRYFPTMSQWVGFRKSFLPVRHANRESGGSSYSLPRLLRLAADNMIAFSDKPLRLFINLGFLLTSVSFLVGLRYLYLALTGRVVVMGFASLIISIWFIGGVLMLALGLLGIYIEKIFSQAKNRPTFIVAERVNLE